MKKIALAVLLALTLLPAASFAQVGVVVRVGPPAPIVEHYGPPPHPGYVWIAGYHRWDGARYVWVAQADGIGRLVRMLCGWLITGYTAVAAGYWWKGTGGKLDFIDETKKRGARPAFWSLARFENQSASPQAVS